MKPRDQKLNHLGDLLLVRGFVLVAAAAIAVRWPEELLAGALRFAGAAAITLGLFELALALAGYALASVRYFRTGHAAASIGFGAVALAVPSVTLAQAHLLGMAWLVAYTLFLALLAGRLWYFRRLRNGLLGWEAVHVAAIAAGTIMPPASLDDLMLVGALYTAAMGTITIVAAQRIRHGWKSSTGTADGPHAQSSAFGGHSSHLHQGKA